MGGKETCGRYMGRADLKGIGVGMGRRSDRSDNYGDIGKERYEGVSSMEGEESCERENWRIDEDG